MNRYNMYCRGGMGCFSTYNPLLVGWAKTRIGRGMYWENEYFVDPADIEEIHDCESNVCNHDGYIEVYPLYSDTIGSGSINQFTCGIITFESGRKEELEEAGFYPIHSDGGFTDFRVPSLELTNYQSKVLMDAISDEVDRDEERKKNFKSFKTQLTLVNGDELITVLDCGEKVHEVTDLADDDHFEFTLSFADQELKLAYTNEQSRLLIECLK